MRLPPWLFPFLHPIPLFFCKSVQRVLNASVENGRFGSIQPCDVIPRLTSASPNFSALRLLLFGFNFRGGKMPGVSAEQQVFSGSLFSEHSRSPCAILPRREEIPNPSSDEAELHARSLQIGTQHADALNFFSSDGANAERCSPRRGNGGSSVGKTLGQSISFGSSGYGFSLADDFPGLGLPFSEGFQKKDDPGSGSIPVQATFSANAAAVAEPPPDALAALQKFLPSNNEDETSWAAADAYSCDEFRMYEFKVRRCMRGRSHDWTECPFAHPGEKARRRDPRRFHYSGTGCPDFRKGSCRRGDACEFAHGVFECWLHPARYRTQPCKDGRNCRRRVCFFAHTPEQLRLLPGSSQVVNVASRNSLRIPLTGSYDGSPLRFAVSGYDGSNSVFCEGGTAASPRAHWGYLCKPSPSQTSSPTSTLVGHSHSPPPLSPPLSPSGSPPTSPDSATSWPGSVTYSMSPRYQKASAVGNMNGLQVQLSPSLGITGPGSAHRRPAEPTGPFASMASSPQLSCVLTQADGQPSSPKAIGDLISCLQNMEVGSAPLWLHQQQQTNCLSPMALGLSAPRAASNLRHCSLSLPSTPTKSRWDSQVDHWEPEIGAEGGLQRVESGRDLRAKIYARLSKEPNPQDIGSSHSNGDSPDLGWVNELVM